MSETNEPVTDRIEAIRARHAARLRTRALPPDWALVNEDMAVLLAEVERLQMKGIEDCRVLHGYLNDRDIEIARRDKVLDGIQDLISAGLRRVNVDLSVTYKVQDVGWRQGVEWVRDMLAALETPEAPVAPDAEPGGAS